MMFASLKLLDTYGDLHFYMARTSLHQCSRPPPVDTFASLSVNL